tara:strand:- start:550 stop:1752 length:1203 start_codon:yes stop_codon:yes gene_type:complete
MRYETTVTKETPAAIAEAITSPYEDLFNEFGVPLESLGPFQRFITEPGLVGDKKTQRERLGNIASFIPFVGQKVAQARGDTLGEYLGYLDALGGKLAVSPLLIAKQKKLKQTLKELDNDPILKNDPTAKTTIKRQLDETEAEIKQQKEVDKRYAKIQEKQREKQSRKFLEDYNRDAYARRAREGMDITGFDFETGLGRVYHGGPSGITSLRTPKFVLDDINNLNKSTGGIYTVTSKFDPRLTMFGANDRAFERFARSRPKERVDKLLEDLPQKSIYVGRPNFSNIADTMDLPPEVIDRLTDIRNAAVTTKGNPYDIALNSRTKGALDMILRNPERGAPAMINKAVGDAFRELGYDAIRFPTRKPKTGGQPLESDTILSLYDELLKDFDETTLAELLQTID